MMKMGRIFLLLGVLFFSTTDVWAGCQGRLVDKQPQAEAFTFLSPDFWRIQGDIRDAQNKVAFLDRETKRLSEKLGNAFWRRAWYSWRLSRAEKKRSAEVERIRSLHAIEQMQIKTEEPRLIELWDEKMSDPRVRSVVEDYMRALEVLSLDRSQLATLLVGNPVSPPDDINRLENMKHFMFHLSEKGYTVVIDADSTSSSALIQQLEKDRRPYLAITGNPERAHTSGQFVLIQNPYLRMMAFSHSQYVFSSANSYVGVGLAFDNRVTGFYTSNKDVSDPFEKWMNHLKLKGKEYDLGIRFRVPKTSKTVSDLLLTHKLPNVDPEFIHHEHRFGQLLGVRIFGKFEHDILAAGRCQLDASDRRDLDIDSYHLTVRDYILSAAVRYVEGVDVLEKIRGAVVFGSGSSKDWFENDLGALAERMAGDNTELTTGGAGGVMKIVNAGAVRAGGISVGIPITGRHALAMEKDIPTEFHTVTFDVLDYTVRIPLLLLNKTRVVFAPGGKGTMKELAATLVVLGAHPDTPMDLEFLDWDQYYTPLMNWFEKHPVLPEQLTSSIRRTRGRP